MLRAFYQVSSVEGGVEHYNLHWPTTPWLVWAIKSAVDIMCCISVLLSCYHVSLPAYTV